LFVNVQLPSVPSLKDKATGTFGSFTIVAHDVIKKIEISFIKFNYIRLYS
jgi:hypothetical protein